jgi:N-acetylneuraminic acid mutarotase
VSVAGVGNQIIAACGYAGGDTATTRIYNIASDTWSFGAPAPGTNSESAGTSHGGLFYSLGGRVSGPGSLARDDLWAYDRTTDLWTVLAPMLTARAGFGIAVQDNTIYAIGGRTGTGGPNTGGVLATVEAYDIDTDTWTPVAPLPSARSDLAAATVGGKIYVFGGINAAGTFLDDVDVYDPITNAWSTAPADMPTARAAFYAVATKGGTVYAIGGWDGVNPGLSTNDAYKVASDTWTSGLLPMPTPRAEAGAVGHGGRIYIVGGSQPAFGNSVDANEVFKP